MSGRKTTQRKAERPSYDNKAVVPAASVKSRNVRIRVLVAHDGLNKGETYWKPRETAEAMQDLGYWEII